MEEDGVGGFFKGLGGGLAGAVTKPISGYINRVRIRVRVRVTKPISGYINRVRVRVRVTKAISGYINSSDRPSDRPTTPRMGIP